MELNKPFYLKVKPTEEIIRLLESVTLGSNGARYRHLDTREKISQLYRPLFLTLEWKGKVLGNVTFCRRECGWYVRYFAFNENLQTSNSTKKSSTNGVLKRELNKFFKNALESKLQDSPDLFYAYIDPQNSRSLWMSEQFGFKTVAKIASQTFSRVKPNLNKNVRALTKEESLTHRERIKESYANHNLFFTKHTFNDSPFYGYFSDEGNLLACVKSERANWRLERLPGVAGGLVTRSIPYIPGVRKIINPKYYSFSTVEALWVDPSISENEEGEIVTDLLEGLLFHEQTNSLIWWVDQKDPLYKKLANQINWGLMHKLNGVNEVDLVVLGDNSKFDNQAVFYTTAFDFI